MALLIKLHDYLHKIYVILQNSNFHITIYLKSPNINPPLNSNKQELRLSFVVSPLSTLQNLVVIDHTISKSKFNQMKTHVINRSYSNIYKCGNKCMHLRDTFKIYIHGHLYAKIS